MMRVEGEPPDQMIDSFIHWRDRMEKMRSSGYWEGMSVMHMLNHMGQFRSELAPWEWIWCPDCGGRGMWVDGGNHWCSRCSGTRILLAEELTGPAEIALVRRTAQPPDWGRLWSRVATRPVPELKVEGES